MFKFLGAAVAAFALTFAGSASAYSYIASFETVGSAPTVRVDPAVGPQYRPGAASVDTIGTVDVLFQWHRTGDFLYPQYDELDALVALGPLAGKLFIEARPSQYQDPRNTTSRGALSIAYSGPTITVSGRTFEAGDYLFRGGLRGYGGGGSGYSDFFYFPSGVGLLELDYSNQTPSGDGWIADVSGTFAAAIPEPTTWAMMIIGFGMSGAALRRSKRVAAAA